MAKNVTRSVVFRRDHASGQPVDAQLRATIAAASAGKLVLVLVGSPQELGDTYEELVASLDALAAAELMVQVMPPTHRVIRQSH